MTQTKTPSREVILSAAKGMPVLLFSLLAALLAIFAAVLAGIRLEAGSSTSGGILLGIALLYLCIIMPILLIGLKIVRPNEALVFTLFGRYLGSLRQPGFYFVHPFASAMPVPSQASTTGELSTENPASIKLENGQVSLSRSNRRLSLKTMTLNNDKQKINDKLGNPIVIGIVVIWRVADTAKALFDVDNYVEFLSIQCDSALRNTVRLYSYDAADAEDTNEKSLRGSSHEISQRLCDEIQEKVLVAGLEIIEARITHLAYAPEIAAAMLQRQQASAIVDARQLIVEGAVGMVEMALQKLSDQEVVELDEERKASMVSNLMVVLCGNRDAQPIINSGSLY